MPDDISIPRDPIGDQRPASFTRSYRTRRPGMDRATRRLLLTAGLLAALLVAGMALWATRTPRPPGLPTIEADSRPVRIKPDDTASTTTLADPADPAEGVTDMAPPAERPDPQALRAQLQATTPPQSPKPPAAPAPSPVPPLAPPAAPPAPTATAPIANGVPAGAAVQLGALTTESAASAEWLRLQKRAPDLLANHTPSVQRAQVDGKTVWRLRTGGFASVADATQFCRKARAKGLDCSLATF